MIETYAFLVMFTIQILETSVLHPFLFVRYMRRRATMIPAGRLAQLYPGVDLTLARERFLTRGRALNTVIAVLGLLLLGWLFSYMRRPEWSVTIVAPLVVAYFMIQMLLPLALVLWHGVRFRREHKRPPPESKRKASLQRRGIFDFISPFTVFLAVLSYLLFVAFVIYLQQHHRIPRPAPFITIGAVTLAYALQVFGVYRTLYGKKADPFETHEGRVRRIGFAVKSCVYACIGCSVFVSLSFALGVLNLQRWTPFATSTFFVICALPNLLFVAVAPRPPDTDGLGSGGAVAPR